MADDYRKMWEELGINLENHDGLLEVLPPLFTDVFLSQEGRPARMSYFDYVFSEVHGLRIQELVNHKKNGGIVVGTYCTYAPEELIMAANGISVGLCAGAEVAPEAAMEFLPGNLCPLIKSSLGFKLAAVCPYIESCDLLIGETTCDGKKKFYEILGDMQPVHVMELPQKKGPKDSELWRGEVREMVARLEEVSGTKVTEAGLKDAIKIVNEKRLALQRLAELRKVDPPVISGRDALLINQIAFNDDPRRFTVKVNDLCDELDRRVKQGKTIGAAARPRIMISGCPMALPNWKLAQTIETSGAVIAMEEMCTGIRYFRNLVDETPSDKEGMLDAIADRYLKIDCAVFTPNTERVENILGLVEAYDIDAVVYHALTACDPYTIEAYKVQKALEEAGVPMLYVETDYGDDSGQIATRIQALLEMVSQ
ncbi:MAG: double-cubane-cluster-containing anaerobic reductase [Candidatus Geothermincolia bacterium]